MGRCESRTVVADTSASSHRPQTADSVRRQTAIHGSCVMSKRVADNSIHAAALSAAALIAHQVGGKATRDTLFLTHFHVSALAWMVMIASVLSIVVGVVAARLMSRSSPQRLIPRAFAASALLLLTAWGLSFKSPAVAAVLVYLQIAALG